MGGQDRAGTGPVRFKDRRMKKKDSGCIDRTDKERRGVSVGSSRSKERRRKRQNPSN